MFIRVGHPNVDAEGLNKILVVVLGMHRSGTSSAAGALVRLGAAAPQHLMAPNADNVRGFWESPVISELNNAILAAGGSDWKDWRKFNLAKIPKVEADALRERAREALRGWRSYIISVINAGIKAQEIRPRIDAKKLATLIISSLEGAIMLFRLERTEETLRVIQAHLDSLQN